MTEVSSTNVIRNRLLHHRLQNAQFPLMSYSFSATRCNNGAPIVKKILLLQFLAKPPHNFVTPFTLYLKTPVSTVKHHVRRVDVYGKYETI
jgi:hypothetical protein